MKVLIIQKDTYNPVTERYEEYNEETWLVSEDFNSDLLPQLWKDYRKENKSETFYRFMLLQGHQLIGFEEVVL